MSPSSDFSIRPAPMAFWKACESAWLSSELHPDKTRRIEFGRFAEENRKRRGEGKPETFDFLGFTHISGKNSLGRFMVRRATIRKRTHDPVSQTGRWLQSSYRATSTTTRCRETSPAWVSFVPG